MSSAEYILTRALEEAQDELRRIEVRIRGATEELQILQERAAEDRQQIDEIREALRALRIGHV